MIGSRILVTFLAIVLVLGCSQATLPDPEARPQAAPSSSSVVMVSFDGVGWEELARRAPSLGANGWNRIMTQGTAARLIPVNPTLTAVTHVAMATGQPPEASGIVSNTMHAPGTPVTQTLSGFSAEIEVPTLWESARLAGKRVGVLTYPGVDQETPRRSADFGLIYTNEVSRSRIVTLARDDFSPVADQRSRVSHSPILAATLTWSWKHESTTIERPLELRAIDTTDDSTVNYDDFEVVFEGSTIDLGEDRWFPLSIPLDDEGTLRRFGSWSKILESEPDLQNVEIYWGSVNRSVAYPAEFQEFVEREAGFWPGAPDGYNASAWVSSRRGIDPLTFIEQLRRFSDFFTRVTTATMDGMEYDLLLAYQPIVDEAEHQWRLTSASQAHSTPENRQAAETVRKEAYATFDAALSRMIDRLDPAETLVVVSDHGLTELHTSVRISGLLADWGYVKVDGNRVAADSPWAAFSSGGAVHIHRSRADAPGSVGDLIERLRALRSPDGNLVFESVEENPAGANPRLGVIRAYTFPGFAMTSSLSGDRFQPTTYYGQHGYLNHHAEMHAIVGAIGPGARPSLPSAVSQTDIAGWINSMLRITPRFP
ncbi:MAG TPA: alkaline phosphatase family protein [Thermoanaerobaculia bacterium]|nr:alkaline phosphatase family protein [Thermoanaerobaculia bacterium]